MASNSLTSSQQSSSNNPQSGGQGGGGSMDSSHESADSPLTGEHHQSSSSRAEHRHHHHRHHHRSHHQYQQQPSQQQQQPQSQPLRHQRSLSSHPQQRRQHSSSNSTSSTPPPSIIRSPTGWFQRKINLRPAHRGCHLITDEVLKQIPEISNFQVGLCTLHIMHTSASLTLNENWDPDVREDMELFLSNFIPENLKFRHGPHEDMPAHVKSCFLGSSLTIPITEGKLSLGVWQGVWLCEHRDNAGSRKLMVTINGALKF